MDIHHTVVFHHILPCQNRPSSSSLLIKWVVGHCGKYAFLQIISVFPKMSIILWFSAVRIDVLSANNKGLEYSLVWGHQSLKIPWIYEILLYCQHSPLLSFLISWQRFSVQDVKVQPLFLLHTHDHWARLEIPSHLLFMKKLLLCQRGKLPLVFHMYFLEIKEMM